MKSYYSELYINLDFAKNDTIIELNKIKIPLMKIECLISDIEGTILYFLLLIFKNFQLFYCFFNF